MCLFLLFSSRFCDNIGNEFMYARFWGQKLTMLLNSIQTATAATKRALNIMNSFPVYSLDWSSLNCKFFPSHTFHFILFSLVLLAPEILFQVKNWKFMLTRNDDDDVLKEAMVAEKLFRNLQKIHLKMHFGNWFFIMWENFTSFIP